MGNEGEKIERNGIPTSNESLIAEISVLSAEAYLTSHLDTEAAIEDTRELMRSNTRLGRMILHTAGQLAKSGITPTDAYLLGVIHGLGLAERRRQEAVLDAHFESSGIFTELAGRRPDDTEPEAGLPPAA